MRAAGVLLLLGCAPPEPPVEVDAGPPLALEVGLAAPDAGFAPMSASVDAVPGSQGGFHVELAYRLAAARAGRLTFRHRVTRVRDGKLVSLGARQWALPDAPWESPEPITVFLCPTPIGVNVIDEPLRLQVTARDGEERLVAEGEASTTLKCGAAQTAFCQSICKG